MDDDGRSSRMRSRDLGPVDLVAQAEQLFVAASELAGRRLTVLASEFGKNYINERDHLQPTYRAALEEVAANASPRPLVSTALGHGLDAVWPRLGKFDVSLQWGAGAAVFGELKCGDSAKTLSACVWDAAKCAFCLRHGVGAGMLLVAASPKPLWSHGTMGVELFFGGGWEMASLRERYAKGFTAWEADGYKPLFVPATFSTTPVGQTEFLIADRPWVLGTARVDAIDETWLQWVPFIP